MIVCLPPGAMQILAVSTDLRLSLYPGQPNLGAHPKQGATPFNTYTNRLRGEQAVPSLAGPVLRLADCSL